MGGPTVPRGACVLMVLALSVRYAVCPLLVRFAVCPLLGLVRVFCLFKLKEISKASCIARLLSSSPSSAVSMDAATLINESVRASGDSTIRQGVRIRPERSGGADSR